MGNGNDTPPEGGAPEGGAPAEGGGAPAGAAPQTVEALQKEMTTLKETMATDALAKEELEGKLESLQDSLDSALEEMALAGGEPVADPADSGYNVGSGGSGAGGDGGGEPPAASPAQPPATPPAAKPGDEDAALAEQIEKGLAEDAAFRSEIRLKDEMRDLRDEVKEAMVKHPGANEDDILRGIEDGSHEDKKDQVEVLAKESEDRIKTNRDGIKKEVEEELKAKLQKESEGGESVPQSQGSPPAPEGAPKDPQLSEDAEWAEALAKAKAEAPGA